MRESRVPWTVSSPWNYLSKVRQTVGGTRLHMLNFRQLGLLKRHYAEVAQPPDVIKSNANKRNNSPNCFGNT